MIPDRSLNTYALLIAVLSKCAHVFGPIVVSHGVYNHGVLIISLKSIISPSYEDNVKSELNSGLIGLIYLPKLNWTKKPYLDVEAWWQCYLKVDAKGIIQRSKGRCCHWVKLLSKNPISGNWKIPDWRNPASPGAGRSPPEGDKVVTSLYANPIRPDMYGTRKHGPFLRWRRIACEGWVTKVQKAAERLDDNYRYYTLFVVACDGWPS